MEKLENPLTVQSELDFEMSIFGDALDEQRFILGLEQVEAPPGPEFVSSHGNQDAADEVTAVFENVVDEKQRILAQDRSGAISTSINVTTQPGSKTETCEEFTILGNVIGEKMHILEARHQDAFPSSSNIVSPLDNQDKSNKETSIFEDALDEKRYILGEETSVGDVAVTFQDPLDEARRTIIKLHPDAFPPPSKLNIALRCEICRSITIDKCLEDLKPRTGIQTAGASGAVGYWHQNSFRDLCQSAIAGCDLCELIKTSILQSGTDESVLHSIEETHENIPVIIRADSYTIGLVPTSGMNRARTSASHLTIQLGLKYKGYNGMLARDLPVVTLQIFTYPDDHAAGDRRITGRPIAFDTNSEACFEFISAWLMQCADTHQRCPDRRPTVLPTRVIDVGPPDGSQEPRLYITSEGETGIYVALSHCWGKEQPLCTKVETLGAMTSQILLGSFPQTFSDAISVIRRLNIRFLWIDSLCIIQDSEKDWKIESSKMRDVYANSFLTISAAIATDSRHELLRRRPECLLSSNVALEHYHPDSDRKGTVYLRPDSDSWRRTVTEGSLSRRAWTFQERLLSPRILHFGVSQIFFECSCQSTAEGYAYGRTPTPGEGGLYHRQSLSKNIIDDWEKQEFLTFPYPFSRWYYCVAEYTRRDLTRPSDKLIAISGIAREIFRRSPAPQNPEAYLAGLWKADIRRGLLWRAVRQMELRPSDSYRAPSWSWAALEGPIKWDAGNFDRFQQGTGAVVVKTEVDFVEERDTFGQVRGGSITIRGPARWGLYSPDWGDTQGVTVGGRRLIGDGEDPCNRVHRLYEQTGEEDKWLPFCTCIFDQNPGTERAVFVLLRIGNWAPTVLTETMEDDSADENLVTFFYRSSRAKYVAWALVLQVVSQEPPRLRRVGIAEMDPSCFEECEIVDTTII